MFSFREPDNVERAFLFVAAISLFVLICTVAYALLDL
ncbi:hypothetical protein AFEL58S_02913 [Afipia felis]